MPVLIKSERGHGANLWILWVPATIICAAGNEKIRSLSFLENYSGNNDILDLCQIPVMPNI